MARQIVITLSDEEYQELERAAEANDLELIDLAYRRYALTRLKAHRKEPLDPVLEAMFLAGELSSIPTGEPASSEEIEELERLAQSIKPGSPTASEMVIEDRGPR